MTRLRTQLVERNFRIIPDEVGITSGQCHEMRFMLSAAAAAAADAAASAAAAHAICMKIQHPLESTHCIINYLIDFECRVIVGN